METRQFRTKVELSLKTILKAKKGRIPFEFVGMDADYGEQPWLLTRLEGNDVVYTSGIPCSPRVYQNRNETENS